MLAAAIPALVPGAAHAQTAPALAPPDTTEQITVVGTSPLLGSGVSRNLIPVSTQVLGSADITRTGAPDVLQALNTQIAGVNFDSASGNQYQPTIFYNGFEVSPLQGTPQGIAVYVNGIRFNSAFGDTVNWDLIPDVAINRINVEGSNPLFGLNALGGSFNVALKDGFSYHGGEADISGGAFGQIQGDVQYGMQSGDQAIYAAGSVIHQDGWRDLQSTDIQNFYTDYGVKHDGTEFHLDLTLANSVINGPGTAPVQLLTVDSHGAIHRAEPDQQPLRAGGGARQYDAERCALAANSGLLQLFPARRAERQRSKRYALRRWQRSVVPVAGRL